MKKLILLAAAVVITSTSSFAQGNVLVALPARGIWDNFTTPGSSKLAATENWTIYFGSSASVPAVSSLSGTQGLGAGANGGTYVPTNSAALGTTSFSIANAWSAILNDANFHQLDGTTAATPITGAVGANGSIVYNGGSGFSADNVIGGTTYTMFLVAWSSAYATPALAAAAGSALGWSQYFQYTPSSGITLPTSMSALPGNFGVFAPVPEPATIALAGLGGLSLLALRRRNSK